VLATTHLQIGRVVNLRVVKQSFPLSSTDDDVDGMMASFEPAANTILLMVNMDEILHANLDP